MVVGLMIASSTRLYDVRTLEQPHCVCYYSILDSSLTTGIGDRTRGPRYFATQRQSGSRIAHPYLNVPIQKHRKPIRVFEGEM